MIDLKTECKFRWHHPGNKLDGLVFERITIDPAPKKVDEAAEVLSTFLYPEHRKDMGCRLNAGGCPRPPVYELKFSEFSILACDMCYGHCDLGGCIQEL